MFNDSENEMISLLRDAVRKKLIREVRDTRMYGFLTDTTPDLSRYDQVTVAISYMKETGLNKRLLALKHVSAKTGVATAKSIVKLFQEFTLDTSQLVSQL